MTQGRSLPARSFAWIVLPLEVEPSWIGEMGVSIGAIMWGVFAITTDDLLVRGAALVLPILAIVLGTARAMVLTQFWYPARVALSGVSFLLWAWLFCALAARYGPSR